MDKTSRSRVGMWIVAAAAVAVVGCRLGQADDAPGLGGLSLLLAMVLHAFIIAGVLSRKCARLVVWALCIVAPFVLYIDGEIAVLSPFWLLFPLGVVFLIMLIKQLRQ